MTIIGFVVAVTVLALDTHARRTRPHVGEKISVTIAPSIANCNSTAAVVLPTGRFGIGTTLKDVVPSGLFPRLPHPN